jgi:mRNA interferase YafQ
VIFGASRHDRPLSPVGEWVTHAFKLELLNPVPQSRFSSIQLTADLTIGKPLIQHHPRCFRDFNRESKGQYHQTLPTDLTAVVVALANDQALEPRHCDHGLTGDWKDHRDCHIKLDLVRIYRLPDEAR